MRRLLGHFDSSPPPQFSGLFVLESRRLGVPTSSGISESRNARPFVRYDAPPIRGHNFLAIDLFEDLVMGGSSHEPI